MLASYLHYTGAVSNLWVCFLLTWLNIWRPRLFLSSLQFQKTHKSPLKWRLLTYVSQWYSQFLPMSDASTYDNMGAKYNVSRVLTPEFTLNEEAYQAYSPLFIRLVTPCRKYRSIIANQTFSTTFAICYGLSFAAIAALVVHTFLHYSGTIWSQFWNSTHEKPDIHMKLMRKYKEAPSWWYTSLFLIVRSVNRGFLT